VQRTQAAAWTDVPVFAAVAIARLTPAQGRPVGRGWESFELSDVPNRSISWPLSAEQSATGAIAFWASIAHATPKSRSSDLTIIKRRPLTFFDSSSPLFILL
jgi:hypothetical protein